MLSQRLFERRYGKEALTCLGERWEAGSSIAGSEYESPIAIGIEHRFVARSSVWSSHNRAERSPKTHRRRNY